MLEKPRETMLVDGVEIEILSPEEAAARDELERREIREHWEQYSALGFREKIRREGIVRWITNTNLGAVLTVVAGLGLLVLATALLH